LAQREKARLAAEAQKRAEEKEARAAAAKAAAEKRAADHLRETEAEMAAS